MQKKYNGYIGHGNNDPFNSHPKEVPICTPSTLINAPLCNTLPFNNQKMSRNSEITFLIRNEAKALA